MLRLGKLPRERLSGAEDEPDVGDEAHPTVGAHRDEAFQDAEKPRVRPVMILVGDYGRAGGRAGARCGG